jgi:hypothetical protein
MRKEMTDIRELMISAYDAIEPWAKGRSVSDIVVAMSFIAFDQMKTNLSEEEVMDMFKQLHHYWSGYGRSE